METHKLLRVTKHMIAINVWKNQHALNFDKASRKDVAKNLINSWGQLETHYF